MITDAPLSENREEPQSVALAPIAPDWKIIRERYLLGDDLGSIAEAQGTTENAISCRAYREGWKDDELYALIRDESALSQDLRESLLVNVLKEARMFAREHPRKNPSERNMLSQCRERLLDAASRLLHWDADPVDKAKHVRCLDV